LYKLISGLQSSISIHIAADYLFDEATNLVQILIYRILRHFIETRVTRTQEIRSQELRALKRQELQIKKLDLLLLI
jgi:hypothetical protein